MSSRSIAAVTNSETQGGVDYFAAWVETSPDEIITACNWWAQWQNPADVTTVPPGPVRRIVQSTDVCGELSLVERSAWLKIRREFEDGNANQLDHASHVYASVMRAPRIILGQWVQGIAGPRIVSVYGADKLRPANDRSARCNTPACLVGIARDLVPPALSISVALMATVEGS